MSTKISDTPWSQFSASDYTIDQYKKACLIVPDGDITSKSACKLPVLEPDGTLNRNAVHAAVAAIDGSRGGMKITTAQKASAKEKLRALYDTLGEQAPAGIMHGTFGGVYLAHHGVKGMHWGHRKGRTSSSSGPSPVRRVKKKIEEHQAQVKKDKATPEAHDHTRAAEAKRIAKNAGTSHLSNAELQHLVNRMNLEEQYTRLTKGQNISAETRVKKILLGASLTKATTARSTPFTSVVGKAVQDSFTGPKKKK